MEVAVTILFGHHVLCSRFINITNHIICIRSDFFANQRSINIFVGKYNKQAINTNDLFNKRLEMMNIALNRCVRALQMRLSLLGATAKIWQRFKIELIVKATRGSQQCAPDVTPESRARGQGSDIAYQRLKTPDFMNGSRDTMALGLGGITVCLPSGTGGHYTLGTWHRSPAPAPTDRVAAGRAGAAAARRAGRAGAWSSRAAGRAGPARAWRGRGRRSWVAPSLRCERPPTERVRETLPCERRFFPTVFLAGAGRGGRPMAARPPRPPPARPRVSTLIYVPYIKRVFRVPLWIFLGVALHTRRRRSP